jgi:hypothetical protein
VLAIALAACATWPAAAADPDAEIRALIDELGSSDCSFERNGRWHDAAEAQAHVRRKYAWLQRRGLVKSAEQFIERAASRSSVSGRPYHVRCPGQPTVESGAWFRTRLARLRVSR